MGGRVREQKVSMSGLHFVNSVCDKIYALPMRLYMHIMCFHLVGIFFGVLKLCHQLTQFSLGVDEYCFLQFLCAI